MVIQTKFTNLGILVIVIILNFFFFFFLIKSEININIFKALKTLSF